MSCAMHHVIFDQSSRLALTRPVAPEDAVYVSDAVAPRLRPLPTNDYFDGPAGILRTLARWSYVLDGEDVFWFVEWNPGLLAVRVSGRDGSLSSCALRSPNPEFGGRVASAEELAAYDEEAHDPQYSLVYRGWDPQLETDRRDEFRAATTDLQIRIDHAMAHLHALDAELERRIGGSTEAWLERCRRSPIWRGEA